MRVIFTLDPDKFTSERLAADPQAGLTYNEADVEFRIGNQILPVHLLAIAVEKGEHGTRAAAPEYVEIVEASINVASEDPVYTFRMQGRDYILVAVPHAAT